MYSLSTLLGIARKTRFSALLPELQNFTTAAYHERLQESALQQAPDELIGVIRKELWRPLTFQQVTGDGPRAKERLAKHYLESADTLGALCSQAERFWEEVVESLIVERGSCPNWEPARLQTREELRSEIKYRLQPPPVVLTADLTLRSTGEIYERLHGDLTRRVELLTNHFVGVLQKGPAAHWLGLVTWLASDTCRFVFPMAPIICLGREKTQREEGTRWVIVRHGYGFQHRLGLHEHHLLRARFKPGVPNQASLPERLHRLVQALPDFVRPLVGVVDGLLIRQRVVEWDVWKSASVSEVRIPVAHPRPMPDPALVLGPYVLAGWLWVRQ